MARSTYVYVVSNAIGPIAGFTVKWELVRWVGTLENSQDLIVTRLRDNKPAATLISYSVAEFLEGA